MTGTGVGYWPHPSAPPSLQEHGGVLLTSCVATALKSMACDMSSTESDRVTLVLCQVFAVSSSEGGVKGAGRGSTTVRSCDLVMPEYLVELSTVRVGVGSCGGGGVEWNGWGWDGWKRRAAVRVV